MERPRREFRIRCSLCLENRLFSETKGIGFGIYGRWQYCDPDCYAIAYKHLYHQDWLLQQEKQRVAKNNVRARKYGTPATLTLRQWIRTLLLYDMRCAYCAYSDFEVLEHRKPLSMGGGTTWDNCVPACHDCNHRKRRNERSTDVMDKFLWELKWFRNPPRQI